MASPYQSAPSDPQGLPPGMDLETLRALGEHALKSGMITPEEAAKHAQDLKDQQQVQRAPAGAPSPYGQPGGMPGPKTQQEAQSAPYQSPAINDAIAANKQQQAVGNQTAVLAQTAPQVAQPPRQATGSGQTVVNKGDTKSTASQTDATTDTASHQADTTATSVDKQGQILHPDQINELNMDYTQLPQWKAAQEGINQQQNLIDMESKRPSAPNMKVVGAFIDQLNNGKTNYAASASSGETPAERANRILSYSQKLAQDKRDAMNTIVNAVGKSRSGMLESALITKLSDKTGTTDKSTDAATQAAGASTTKTATDPNAMIRGGRVNPVTAANQFNTYSKGQLSTNDKSADQLNAIASEVGSGNPIDDARMAVLRASMDAVGRPNIAEVKLESGDQSVLERARQTAVRAMSGTLTDHNRDLILESLQTIAGVKQKERQMYVDKLKAQGKTQYQQNDQQLNAAFPEGYANRFKMGQDAAGAARDKIKAGNPATAAPGAAPAGGDIQGIDNYFKAKGQ